MGSLTLFIDSLPWGIAEESGFLRSMLPVRRPLVPGHGYSINQYFQLFCGRPPAEAGFFNVWNWRGRAPTALERLPALLAPFDADWRTSYLVRKPLQRVGVNFDFVPFRVLPYLRRREFHLSRMDFGCPTLFDLPDVQASAPPALPPGPRDASVADAARRSIGESTPRQHLFFFFLDLDGVGHKFGVEAEGYRAKVEWLERTAAELLHRYGERHPGNAVRVLSDHGMVAITDSHRLGLEGAFGKPRPGRYIAVEDATIARVWAVPELRPEIDSFLRDRGIGRVLGAAERERYGLGPREFGDLIYLLDEGGFFDEGIYRPGATPVAMHGYDPELPSQHGVYLTTDGPGGREIRASAAYQDMRASLAGTPS